MTEGIRVPTGVLVGGVLALLCASVTAAYFAGRTASVAGVAVAAPSSRDALPLTPVAAHSRDAADTTPSFAPPNAPSPTVVQDVASTATPPKTPVPSATSPSATPSSAIPSNVAAQTVTEPSATPPGTNTAALEGAAVKRYFDEVDILAASAGGSGDVNQFAAGVLGQDPTKGGGVSDLASSQRHVRDAIAQIAAPAPCKDHQRQTLALMDDGSTMLDELTRAIAANDQARMVTIASRARTLQERARAIAQLAADVKEKYRL